MRAKRRKNRLETAHSVLLYSQNTHTASLNSFVNLTIKRKLVTQLTIAMYWTEMIQDSLNFST
jgi:hypothetical protein